MNSNSHRFSYRNMVMWLARFSLIGLACAAINLFDPGLQSKAHGYILCGLAIISIAQEALAGRLSKRKEEASKLSGLKSSELEDTIGDLERRSDLAERVWAFSLALRLIVGVMGGILAYGTPGATTREWMCYAGYALTMVGFGLFLQTYMLYRYVDKKVSDLQAKQMLETARNASAKKLEESRKPDWDSKLNKEGFDKVEIHITPQS